jgi:hypothetical protein
MNLQELSTKLTELKVSPSTYYLHGLFGSFFETNRDHFFLPAS